jgi:cell division protein ZapA (FtsZ GTPase activity inhibitor)
LDVTIRSVAITVAGVRLNLRTDASDADLAAIVDEVQGRLAQIQSAPRGTTPAHIHLLVALTLADDLRKVRNELAALRTDLGALVERARNDLNDAVPPADPRQ